MVVNLPDSVTDSPNAVKVHCFTLSRPIAPVGSLARSLACPRPLALTPTWPDKWLGYWRLRTSDLFGLRKDAAPSGRPSLPYPYISPVFFYVKLSGIVWLWHPAHSSVQVAATMHSQTTVTCGSRRTLGTGWREWEEGGACGHWSGLF